MKGIYTSRGMIYVAALGKRPSTAFDQETAIRDQSQHKNDKHPKSAHMQPITWLGAENLMHNAAFVTLRDTFIAEIRPCQEAVALTACNSPLDFLHGRWLMAV